MQTKGHQLKEIWDIEDAVATANQSAAIAKQYYQLTARNVSTVSLQLDQLASRLNHATDQIKRLESLIDGNRNTCLVWGISGAIISSLVMSLVLVPSVTPQRIQQTVIEPVQQSAIVEPPPIQEPVVKPILKPKAVRKGK